VVVGSRVLRVRVRGPLVPHRAGFQSWLEGQGYTAISITHLIRTMAHLSGWMEERSLETQDLLPAQLDDFVAARRAKGGSRWFSEPGLPRLIQYLRDIGATPPAPAVVPETPDQRVMQQFREYLLQERALSPTTVWAYTHTSRRFLSSLSHGADGQVNLEELSPEDVNRFVLHECRKLTTGSAKYEVVGLRSFLRFLHTCGLMANPLAGAVPGVSGWGLAALPRALDAAQVAALTASCDRTSALGRRDFAVLIVLTRLGLRANEVAQLDLHDVDWRGGEIVVHAKGRRDDRLPLPSDVGEAVADWLQHGRPRCASSKVFTRLRAPHVGLTTGGVSAIVRQACKRAGTPMVGPHRLRHTLATAMLRAGAPLPEISQVLRHHKSRTTAIYAKVDHAALSSLVRPWPGGAA
jgi:integrase/recombinase XerD